MCKDDNIKVIAVVVTYNRKNLLVECIKSILSQTYPLNKIILIDNASTDGTRTALIEEGILSQKTVEYIRMKKNIGGAGGFYEGIKRAVRNECDWVWVMDDDTIPAHDCLKKLIDAEIFISQNEKLSFLASTIYGADGEFMNVPDINYDKASNGYCYWYKYLVKGMVNISRATFVSILINIDAIKVCGLPCRDYFIWGDDSEYTKRLTAYFGDAYMVGNSIAIHKRISAGDINIIDEINEQRIKLFYYAYRNSIINICYYQSAYKVLIKILYNIKDGIRCIGKPLANKKVNVIIKGTVAGLLQYRKFKKYIDNQMSEKIREIRRSPND